LTKQIDDEFYDRADAHIRVATEHLTEVPSGRVSASLMYACARFNVWVGTSGRASPADVRKAYGETIEYFVAEYRKMLVKNLDDYVENFDKYAPQASESN
jgi:hypothetical protein